MIVFGRIMDKESLLGFAAHPSRAISSFQDSEKFSRASRFKASQCRCESRQDSLVTRGDVEPCALWYLKYLPDAKTQSRTSLTNAGSFLRSRSSLSSQSKVSESKARSQFVFIWIDPAKVMRVFLMSNNCASYRIVLHTRQRLAGKVISSLHLVCPRQKASLNRQHPRSVSSTACNLMWFEFFSFSLS